MEKEIEIKKLNNKIKKLEEENESMKSLVNFAQSYITLINDYLKLQEFKNIDCTLDIDFDVNI